MSQQVIGRHHLYDYKQLVPRFIVSVIAYVMLTGLIAGSFMPSKQKIRIGTQQPQDPRKGVLVSREHRAYHFGSFGLTTLAFLLLARTTRGEIITGVSMFTLGCAIEMTQCLIARDHLLEWWDIRDDGYAIAGACLLIQIANAVSNRRSSRASIL